MIKSVAVYCFENPSTDEDKVCTDLHRIAARLLGQELAIRGITLVTGGMRHGLMGVVTDAALEAGGKVVGVIPREFPESNRHPGLTETIIVNSPAERKDVMMRRSDASCTLPGGAGTQAEYWNERDILKEILKNYGKASTFGVKPDRPIVLCNVAGFYDPTLQQLKNMGEVKENTKDLDATSAVDPAAGSVYDALLELRVITPDQHFSVYQGLMRLHRVSTKQDVDELIRPITARERSTTEMRSHRAWIGGALAAGIAFGTTPFWGSLSHRSSLPYVDPLEMHLALNPAISAHVGERPPFQCDEVGWRILGTQMNMRTAADKTQFDEHSGPVLGCDAVTNKILALNLQSLVRAQAPLTQMEIDQETTARLNMFGALTAMFSGLASMVCGKRNLRVARVRPLFDRGPRGVTSDWSPES